LERRSIRTNYRAIEAGQWRLSTATSEFITHLVIFFCRQLVAQISGDFGELFESGFDVVNDFLGEKIGLRT